jgi:hypothetical protein
VRWTVDNSIGAEGLPVDAWAAGARARLLADPAVIHAKIAAPHEQDEVDGSDLAGVAVSVTVESGDSTSAAAIVEKSVIAALADVVGDRDVGWTSHPLEATPVHATGEPGPPDPTEH